MNQMVLQAIITIVCAVLASSGFWAYMQKKQDCKGDQTLMLIGLGHDRIVYLGLSYIERGYISQDEYENLHQYLYAPYERLGGNGTAKRIMDEVSKLPMRKLTFSTKEVQDEK